MALAFLGFLLLLVPPAVVGQPGFLSIDCGLDANFNDYKEQRTGIFYVTDGPPYIDAGENHKVSPELEGSSLKYRNTLRSFPTGQQNCYALPSEAGTKYLVRAVFAYGNYDGKNSSSLEFDLRLGPNYWDTVNPHAYRSIAYEALFVAWASSVPVCLVNTGRGTPFVSALELRPLSTALYPPLKEGLIMSTYKRSNMGESLSTIRYPDDEYDRSWWPMEQIIQRIANRSTQQPVQPDTNFAVPSRVLQTAIEPAGNNTVLGVYLWRDTRKAYSFMIFLHFSDFQSTQLREFGIYFNVDQSGPNKKSYIPSSLAGSCVYNTDPYMSPDGNYNIILAATTTSVLPPMVNAIEIYNIIPWESPTTFSKDFNAIMAVKFEYGVKKNWMGDPCFPIKFRWEGVTCSNTSDNTTRITSLVISNYSLSGVISKNFTLLTALENLDLSYNNLTGSIPDSLLSLPSLRALNLSGNHLSGDSLCKNYTGSLVLRYDSNGYKCGNIAPSPARTKVVVIAIAVGVPVLVVVVLLLSFFIWRVKRKPNVQPAPTNDPVRDPQQKNTLGNRESHVGHLQKTENRRFTYKELEKFTSNFKQFIGQGGFGPVYYGCLEDGTEVAVKLRSESSSHGFDEFLAEVESLTKVHHRNIVSLIGYCWEKDYLALVYEYMPHGSLFDRLRGKNGVAGTLNWATRVRVLVEAAQGLDYLHKGCSPPIIHRDVKSSNILLGQNLQAKIADLGLSRAYLSDAQTHISATAAGTPGFMDPEYYLTGRLTESSDVYSFGIVLLEVATGEPPMVPGLGHIVQRVKQMIARGDIGSVADARLGGAYDISSTWKLVDTAIMCTAESAAQRPTMATVVAQLKESLTLEEAREKETISSASRGSDIPPMASTFRPMAR